jgi:hypothetical protein
MLGRMKKSIAFLAILCVSCHGTKEVYKKDKTLSVSTEKVNTIVLREDSLLTEIHGQQIFFSVPDSTGRQYIESVRTTDVKAVRGTNVKEVEVKETDSVVQAEAESKEKAKKDFPVWYIALIVCVLVFVIVRVVFFVLKGRFCDKNQSV